MGGIPRKRTEDKEIGQELAALDPEAMRAYLLDHPMSAGGRLWCDRVIQGVAAGERTAMRLFGDAMRWTGAQVNIGQLMIQVAGVKDERELKGLVEQGRRFAELSQDTSHEQVLAEAEAALKDLYRLHPEWQGASLARLGSHATAINGNGAEH